MIVAQGGAFAGWSLYAKDGRPKYCYNLFGVQHFHVEGDAEIPAGTHQVRMEFDYDGGGLGKGGTVSLYLDGAKTGEGRVEGTVPMVFSADETCDIGSDTASPVSADYTSQGSHFTGAVELGADRHRRRRRGPRPPDLPRGAAQDRHDEAVTGRARAPPP